MTPQPQHPNPDRVGGWELVGRISPRPVVRVAAIDAHGGVLNSYPSVAPVCGEPPRVPWAVYLADEAGRYRLLCADLDAQTSTLAAAQDASRLSELFTEVGIGHVVCASGPTGGRHVWVGLAESLDPEVVRTLAYLLQAWLPTLDIAPLVNPATGCVRPPGAPHRQGGTSQPLCGNLSVLTHPTTTTADVHRLGTRLAELVNPTTPTPNARAREVTRDESGIYLPGRKRALSLQVEQLLAVPPEGDASAVLWRLLCGAAAAHWRYSDIQAIADAPGLEHARTLRVGNSRQPRPKWGTTSPEAVLRRQWARAVTKVAQTPPPVSNTPGDLGFAVRAEQVTAVVRTVQGRADATPARWGTSRAGLAQRRVLDALCLFHLQAVRVDEVEADIRRLAMTTGIDRETVRRSLLALAADGWISRTKAAVGRRGACWTIDPQGVIHSHTIGVLSQADPRPAGSGPAVWKVLTNQIKTRLELGSHDAFAPTGGLGIEAGSLYARLDEPGDTVDNAHRFGWTPTKTNQLLQQLAQVGLVHHDNCWKRTPTTRLDAVADELGTTGFGQRRAERYQLERALWAWWLTELEHMRAPHQTTPRQHPAHHRVGRPRRRPAHPRRRDGRADYAAARRVLQQQPGWTQRWCQDVKHRFPHECESYSPRNVPPGPHLTEQRQGSTGPRHLRNQSNKKLFKEFSVKVSLNRPSFYFW